MWTWVSREIDAVLLEASAGTGAGRLVGVTGLAAGRRLRVRGRSARSGRWDSARRARVRGLRAQPRSEAERRRATRSCSRGPTPSRPSTRDGSDEDAYLAEGRRVRRRSPSWSSRCGTASRRAASAAPVTSSITRCGTGTPVVHLDPFRGASVDRLGDGLMPTHYDAFISYSHTADGKLAPAVQNGLQRLARSWRSVRALKVFRDETGLSVNPHLWIVDPGGARALALLRAHGVARRGTLRVGEPRDRVLADRDAPATASCRC